MTIVSDHSHRSEQTCGAEEPMKQSWVSIYGNVDVVEGIITHVPIAASEGPNETPAPDNAAMQPSHSIVRSNLEFEQGAITWEAKLGESSARIQLMLPVDAGTAAVSDSAKGVSGAAELSAGLNVLGAPYGFAVWNGGWQPAGGSGHGSRLPVDEWLPLKVTVRGSTVDLYVHSVKVMSTNRMLKKGQVSFFLQGNKACAIRNVTVTQDAAMCFAVMQFTDEFNALYQDVIRPACESYGFKVVRADDFYTSGQIVDDVTKSIRSAALIIADVTPDNANVFYEVGFAHAIGKPTILLSDRKRDRLPFDISGFRTIFYENTIGGKAAIDARLRQHLEALRNA